MTTSAAEGLRAPDIAGVVEAWRAWRVTVIDDEYVLGSVLRQICWPPHRPLRAECLHHRLPVAWFGGRRHEAPEGSCQCGIYGAQLPQVSHYLCEMPFSERGARPTVARVLGQVALWGTVVECERGFRASHAYPIRIYVPRDDHFHEFADADRVVAGLSCYGVPVEPMDASCAEAPRVLAREFANDD